MLKYSISYNRFEVLILNVRRLLTESTTELFEGSDEVRPYDERYQQEEDGYPEGDDRADRMIFSQDICNLAYDLFTIEGVSAVKFKRHEIFIHKGELWGWREMIQQVLGAVQVNLALLDDFRMVRPPLRLFYDKNGNVLQEEVNLDGSPLKHQPLR